MKAEMDVRTYQGPGHKSGIVGLRVYPDTADDAQLLDQLAAAGPHTWIKVPNGGFTFHYISSPNESLMTED